MYITNMCVVRELFRCFENEYTVFSPMTNCFELYGLDFLVDESFNVHFLEVNPGPDFKQTGQRLRRVIEALFEQTCAIVVDTDILHGEGEFREEEIDAITNTTATDFIKVYDKKWSASNIKSGMSFY